jgi:hypothetical protein
LTGQGARAYESSMITAVRINSFRGIQTGGLEELSRLCVLVGPSGCGKSTLLDALLIGASPSPGDAVGRVVRRRSELWHGARWLFWRGGRAETRPALLEVELEGGKKQVATLRLAEDVSSGLTSQLVQQGKPGPYSEIEMQVEVGGESLVCRTAFSIENEYVFLQEGSTGLRSTLRERPRVRLVESRPGGLHGSLPRMYSDAVEAGRLQDILSMVTGVVPGLTNILTLTEAGGHPVVHLTFADHSVPVAVAGDGVHSLVRLCFELGAVSQGTVLLEEPEAHLHPRAVYRSAQAVVAAVRKGVQVVVTTHSLEWLDALLAELGEEGLGLLSVHGVALGSQGTLKVSRYAGPEVAFAREQIGEDLR